MPHADTHHTPPVKLGMVEALISAMTEEEVKRKSEEKNGSKEPPAQRLYDKEGYRKRVDCVLFRDAKKEEVLLVSSRNHPESWTVPGGGIEPLETPIQAAIREGHEEAGVICDTIGSIGVFEDKERMTRTEAFSMLVTGEVESYMDNRNWGRSRKWFPVKEAIKILISRQKYDKSSYFKLAGCHVESSS